jgi:hypothetical protein
MKKRGTIAISQIILLVVSIIAIAYAISSSIGVVSAQEEFLKVGECVKVNDKIWRVKTNGPDADDIECIGCVPPEEKSVPGFCNENKKLCRTESTPFKIYAIYKTDCAPTIPPGQPSVTRFFTPHVVGIERLIPEEMEKETEPSPPGEEKPKPNITTRKFITGIITDVAIATSIYTGIRYLGPEIGLSRELSDALGQSITVGWVVYRGLFRFGGGLGISGWGAFGIGAGIAAIVFAVSFKETKYDLVSFSCDPWEAQTGGEDCEKCNTQTVLPCTEYQCRSLGQACELINKGTNEERCVWKDPRDVDPPIIQPWEDTLTAGYKYVPGDAVYPDRGVKIIKEGDPISGCVEAFTPLRFGVILDEPAKCKLDYSRKTSFDDMAFFFGGSSLSRYNHSQTLSIPSIEALAAENITLENGGKFSMHTRCQDANGNSNTANFVFNLCVDEGPDQTCPSVVTTNLLNGMPIGHGETSIDLLLYVNEPADCKWSHLDQSYDNMENQMSCSKNVMEMNAQMLYQCSTTLTGINDLVENKFYIRCKDQPHLAGTEEEGIRCANAESYVFTIMGTRPLVIDWVKPNGTIKDSTDVIKVTLEAHTSAGYKEGEATCYFSETPDEDSYVKFYETGTYIHSQDLWLAEGDYTYYIKCLDLGGNADYKSTDFRVESDSSAPVVVRAYHEENYLKIITDEDGSCVYDNADCTYLFEDGILMKNVEDIEHFTEWNPNLNFYIKCEDEFQNRPDPNQCSIIARPFERD